MLVLFYLLYITAPLGSRPEVSAVSCREIKASEGKNVISKKYWLDLNGSGQAVLVYCDMEIEGFHSQLDYSLLFNLKQVFCDLCFYFMRFRSLSSGLVP